MQPRLSTPDTPFCRIRTWIFDLDNTLYPPSARLFDQINARMTAFIQRQIGVERRDADRLRRQWWQSHGTTLAGMMAKHAVDPDAFLAEAHDIDLSALRPDPDLAAAIAALPGRKIIHTNGSRGHADRVLAARGLGALFDARYGIEDKGLTPKPNPDAYHRIIAQDGLVPDTAAMIEDDAGNLATPKQLGMATVWLCHQDGVRAPPHVDRRIRDLTRFLRAPG